MSIFTIRRCGTDRGHRASPAPTARVAVLPLGVLAAFALVSGAAGQAPADTVSAPDSTATFEGTVASAIDGLEVVGARVVFPELSRGDITDSVGRFQVDDLPAGEFAVRVEYFGFSTNESPIELRAGHVTTATFLLERDALEVAELFVEVKRPRVAHDATWMRDFRRRMSEGFGHFTTRDQIEEIRPRLASDLFRRIPGVNVSSGGFAGADIFLIVGARRCRPALFVDGVLTGRYPIDDLHPDDIEGIEVYRRATQTPLQFKRGSCGTVLIWTRTGG